MKIISHRGAAGLAPENTLLGIKVALEHKVEYIEVDVQTTKDSQLILYHDESVRGEKGRQIKIKDSTLSEIRSADVYGQRIATLKEALKTAQKTPLLIDCKGNDWVEPLAAQLKRSKGPKPIIASDDSKLLFAFKQVMPDAECFLSELTKPFEAIQTAKALNFSGVCLLYSIYNPLVYWLAKRDKLKMTMYTVNRPISAWFLHFFYPDVLITTDYPDRFAPRLQRKNRT